MARLPHGGSRPIVWELLLYGNDNASSPKYNYKKFKKNLFHRIQFLDENKCAVKKSVKIGTQ